MKQQIIELTKRLISIESDKDNSQNLHEVLNVSKDVLNIFSKKDYLKNNSPSVLFFNKPAKKFKVILNAHLDIVPGLPSQFRPKVVGNKLYGRGAYDMKAGAACEILAFKEVANKINYPLALQLVTDEEIGGFNGTKHQVNKGVVADFVIAGESTNFQVNNEAKGVLWIKVTAKGKSAHGARPWDGENAIQKINAFINKLNQAFPIPPKPVWKTTQNLATIYSSNKTYNKVPDDCSAAFDIRFVPSEEKTIVSKIKRLIPKGLVLEITTSEPSQFTNKNNPFIKTLQSSIKKVAKKTPKLVSYHGASDVRHFNSVNVPGVCFGPIGAGLHSDNEWVDVNSLVDYYNILVNFLSTRFDT